MEEEREEEKHLERRGETRQLSTDHDGDGAEREVELQVFMEVLTQLCTPHYIAQLRMAV